jgi:hypothetical protein
VASNKKNLLEAFRDAGGERDRPPEPAPLASRPTSAPRAAAPSAPHASAALDRARGLLGELPGWTPWAAGIAVAFVLGVWLGGSGSDSSAAAGSGTEPAGERPAREQDASAHTASAPGAALPAVDPKAEASLRVSPLYDLANRYTLVVATYGKSKQDFAWATHDQLADEGLPVFPPVAVRDDLLVLVGAAPSAGELSALQTRVRGLKGWDGSRESYADAYPILIDRLIDRSASETTEDKNR